MPKNSVFTVEEIQALPGEQLVAKFRANCESLGMSSLAPGGLPAGATINNDVDLLENELMRRLAVSRH